MCVHRARASRRSVVGAAVAVLCCCAAGCAAVCWSLRCSEHVAPGMAVIMLGGRHCSWQRGLGVSQGRRSGLTVVVWYRMC
jgi:hypothetical protein